MLLLVGDAKRLARPLPFTSLRDDDDREARKWQDAEDEGASRVGGGRGDERSPNHRAVH